MILEPVYINSEARTCNSRDWLILLANNNHGFLHYRLNVNIKQDSWFYISMLMFSHSGRNIWSPKLNSL